MSAEPKFYISYKKYHKSNYQQLPDDFRQRLREKYDLTQFYEQYESKTIKGRIL